MRKTIVVLCLCLAVAMAGGLASEAAAAESDQPLVQAQTAGITFPDVPVGSVYYDGIMYLAERGIIGGYSSGLFGPYDALNRAQLAKMIVKIRGLHTPSVPTGAGTFPDVPNDATTTPLFDYVEEAAANGLVQGYADGNFGPYDEVTRIQLTRIVVRAFPGLDTPPLGYASGFSDVAAEDEPLVARAKYNGLIEGTSSTAFDPYGPANRGQTAKMLYTADTVAGGGDSPLRLAYDRNFAPFAYEDEGVARGWSIELVQAACDAVGIEVILIPTDMPAQANMFARGQLDGVIDKAVTPPRVLKEFEFSQHYVLTGAALLRPLGEPALALADAAELTLVTPGTGPVYAYLQAAVPTATLVSVPDYRASYEAVLAGTADAAAVNADVGYDLAEKMFPGRFGRPGTRFMEVGLAIARPKDMGRGFLDSFDAGLATIRSNGKLAAILGER